tara:strand:- start:14168 stop:21673 length:7506 start_codon:yes stop_codon:yes gene_type:complete
MEPEDIQKFLTNFQNAGVSEEDINFYFSQRGVEKNQWEGLYGQMPPQPQEQEGVLLKKKSSASVSSQEEGSSVSESAGNQTQGNITSASGSAGGSSKVSWGPTEFSSVVLGGPDQKSKKEVDSADNDVASRVAENKTIFSTMQAVGEIFSAWQDGKDIAEGNKTSGVIVPPARFDRDWNSTDIERAQNLYGALPAWEKGGVWSEKDETVISVRRDKAIAEAIARGGGEDEIARAIVSSGELDTKANQLYLKAFGEDSDAEEIIKVDGWGNTYLDQYQLVKLQEAMVPIQKKMIQAQAKDEAILADYGEAMEFAFDVNTGIRTMGNSIAGLYGELTGNQGIVEQQQYDEYINSFRTQASYAHDGLTKEEIEKGISGNISDGNLDAASAMFMTAAAQTLPQLVMQIGITAATSGLGTGVALTAGALSMGISAGGATLVDTYGMMSDSKRRTMALGDAVVEVLSERLFSGDMLSIIKKSELAGMTAKQIKSALFKKGIMSEEFTRLAKFAAKDGVKSFFVQGGEEAIEEFFAGVGSQFVHAAINDEEFSMSEALDGAIVGFGMGGGISSVKTTRQLLTMGMSSIGLAGFRNNIVQLSTNRQRLAEELREASTDVQKAAVEAKLQELKVMEAALTEEQLQVYNEYTDEDAELTLKTNRALTDASNKLKNKGLTAEQKAEIKAEMANGIAIIKGVEAKYEPNRKEIQRERETLKAFEYGETGSLELTEESDNQGSKLVQSLINVYKSLRGNKVVVHKDYDAMAKSTNVDKSELLGSRGIYKDSDGSIHILLPAAMSNTGFHEAFHDVAKDVDPNYIAKFIKAALPSLSMLGGGLSQKYQDIIEEYKDNKELMFEELFAELNGDIAVGAISIDNIGTSLASAAATALNSAFRKTMPFLKLKANPSFSSFAKYVGKVTEDIKTGRALTESIAKKSAKKKSAVDKVKTESEQKKETFKSQLESFNKEKKEKPVALSKISKLVNDAVEKALKDYVNGKGEVGFSIKLSDMTTPTKGYAVSLENFETTKTMDELMAMSKTDRKKAVNEISKKVHDAAGDAYNAHLGGWMAGGVFYFDLSEVWSDKSLAMHLGSIRNQDGVYDVLGDKTISNEDFPKEGEGGKYEGLTEQQAIELYQRGSIKKQATIFSFINKMVKDGMSKAQVINSMIESGVSEKDAEMLWNKAKGYLKGSAAGYSAGKKATAAAYRQQFEERRKKEGEASKALRDRFSSLMANKDLTTKEIIKELYEVIKGYEGVTLTLRQMISVLGITAMASRKGGRSVDAAHNEAVVAAAVERIVDILEKQLTVEQVNEQKKTIKTVRAIQKDLKKKLKKMSISARGQLTVYKSQINRLTSIDPAFLSHESALELLEGLNALNKSVIPVTASKNKAGDIVLSDTSLREGRVYFDELFAVLNMEAMQIENQHVVRQATLVSENSDMSWEEAYRNLLLSRAEKGVNKYAKALKVIAKNYGLDIETVAGLEEALERQAAQTEADKGEKKAGLIEEGILPAVMTHRRTLELDNAFASMFNLQADLSEEAMEDMIRGRLERLTTGELQRMEFMVYSYIVNDTTYGVQSLASVVAAKNEGSDRLSKLNMKAANTAGKRGGVYRNYVFSWLETTPTFFRRLFMNYSEKKTTDYMSAIGFSNLRSHTQQADARATRTMEAIMANAKENGMFTPKNETLLHMYSMLMQKPEGLTDVEWLVLVKNQFTQAISKDGRFKDKELESKAEAVDEIFGDGMAFEDAIKRLESVDGLVNTHDFMVSEFLLQSVSLKDYAENFLGQEFVGEDNYLPFSFIKGSDKTEDLSEALASASDIRGALTSYSRSKLEGRAGSTYERNPDAVRSTDRFVNMKFFSTIEKVNRDNEIKIATSADIAYISEMTSERNTEFVDSVPQDAMRHQLRQKVYDYMIAQKGSLGDELLSPGGKRFINKLRSVTVVFYFGSIVDQVIKQSAPIWNTMMETKNMDSKLEALINIARLIAKGTGLMEDSAEDEYRTKVMNSFDIQNRNVQDANIGFERSETGEPTVFERGMDISTSGLRVTDRVTATASWLAYYKDYLYENTDVTPSDFSWEQAAKNPSKKAGDWASAMVAKDQNISTGRDRSKWGRYTKGNVMGLAKLATIPFIDFLMNKKLNMILDVQKALMGGQMSKDAARSIAGTTLEIAHFQTATWFIIAPMIQSLASVFFGAEDDEDRSWFDKKFNWDMWKKGMITDLNPVVMPIAFVESGFVWLANMVSYTFSDDKEVLNKLSGDGFFSGFKVWEKTNGIPIFGGTPRGDLDWLQKIFSQMGVVGSIATQYSIAIKNTVSLSEDVPYYTTTYGTKKYLTESQAERMMFMEVAKLTVMTIGFGTGIMAKEVNATIKAGERGVGKRAASSKDKGIENLIAERLINEEEGATDILFDELSKRVEMNPATAEAWVKSRKTGFLKRMKSELTKNVKFIATARDIEKRYRSAQQKAYIIRNIAEEMPVEDRDAFRNYMYVYFTINGSKGTATDIEIADKLMYGDSELKK